MPGSPHAHASTRPFRLWVLWFGFLIFGLSGWVRAIYAIANWYWLSFSGMTPGPLYLVISGILWGLVGSVIAAWFILRRPWFHLAGFVAAVVYALLYWGDWLLFHLAPLSGDNTAFAVILTFFLLLYTLAVLQPWEDLQSLRNQGSANPTGKAHASSTADGD